MSEVITFAEISTYLSENFSGSWVDMDFGQLDAEEKELPMNPEIILIGFSGTDWSTGGKGYQQGYAEISFRISIQHPEDSYALSASRERSIEKMKRVHEIHSKLQGLTGTCFSPLDRTRSSMPRIDDGTRVFMLTYRTYITEVPTVETRTMLVDPVPTHNPALQP